MILFLNYVLLCGHIVSWKCNILYSENEPNVGQFPKRSHLIFAKDLMILFAVNMCPDPLEPGGLSLSNSMLCVTVAIVWNNIEYF
jgi:hypothetical protein